MANVWNTHSQFLILNVLNSQTPYIFSDSVHTTCAIDFTTASVAGNKQGTKWAPWCLGACHFQKH